MRFESNFDVDAPLEQVWEAMLDVERVAPTVPGAQVLERTGDDSYKVAIKVKVGPMSMTYRGEVEITERDETAHRAVMKARAKESRGQGTADADVTMQLSGANGGTAATVTTEVQLSGKVATMGQGVLQDVSGRLVQTFAQNLAAMLEGGGVPEGEPARPTVESGPEPPAAGEEPPTVAEAGTAGERREPPAAAADHRAPPPADDALDLGSIGGALVAERLRDPRALGALLALAALIGYLLGRRG
jgi:carbon monoxide dehydrogenase subunit G